MRIAIDARFYRKSTGGIGRYTRNLIKELADIDSSNEYTIFITPSDETEYDQEIDSNKYKNFHKYVLPIVHFTLSEQTKFLNILNKEKFDLVHFANFNHPILYKKDFVVTIHDLTMLLFPSEGAQKSYLRRIAFRKVFNNAVNASNKIISISNSTKRDLENYLHASPKKIEVVYEGIDKNYQPLKSQSKIERFKAKYNIGKPYILFVSQWRPHKGLPELIRAFEILKEKYFLEHKLVLVGKSDKSFPNVISAVDKCKYSKDIIRPGFVVEEDLPYFYAASDVFVFPSHYEGFGLPPLEAMSSGVPVAASNVSSIPEILGKAAVYFDPYKPEDIAKQIFRIVSDDKFKKQLIKDGITQAKKYSWHKMAQETLAVYESVVKG